MLRSDDNAGESSQSSEPQQQRRHARRRPERQGAAGAPPPPPEKPRRADGRRRAMKKVDELHPAVEPTAGIGTNWLSGEERSRLEAVQRDWRLSRPYNANATNRPWIRARHREQSTQDVSAAAPQQKMEVQL